MVVQYDEDTKEIESEILEANFHLLIGGCYEMKIGGQWCVVNGRSVLSALLHYLC